MAGQLVRHQRVGAPGQRCRAARRVQAAAVVVRCQQAPAPRPQPQQPQQHSSSLGSKLAGAGLAVAIGLLGCTAGVSPAAAAEFNTLADVMREEFAFVDSNKDGLVSKDEILEVSKKVAEEEEFLVPPDEQIEFTMRLFDLNQDGRLTLDEMLTAMALDRGVEDGALIDEDVLKTFDRNGDGFVDMKEWKEPFGDLGANGEAVKEFVFRRVDQLDNNDRKLGVDEFGNAFTLVRTTVLGF